MKSYIIKIGSLYFKSMKLDFGEIETDFIKDIQLSIKEEALLFNDKEQAKLMGNKIFIVTGAKAEVVDYEN